MVRRLGVWAGIALLGVGIAGLLVGPGLAGATGGSTGGSSGGPWPYGMMSGILGNGGSSGYGFRMMEGYSYGGMMGSYGGGGLGSTVSTATVVRMGNAIPQEASVDRGRDRITFAGRDVRFDVVASPMGQKDQTFRIAGLENPTILVPRGATVHIIFVNADANMPHDFVVTPTQPPFAYATMMQARIAFPRAITPILGTPIGSSAGEIETSFVANAPGQYTYLCTVPGHAEQGMYGKFIVRG